MSTRCVLATLIAIQFPLSLLAQSCPKQTTEHIASTLQKGPDTECTGIDYKFGNVAVTTTQSACPTFVIYTPPHDIAKPAQEDTKVQVVGLSPITMITFRCDRSYLLFIPLSSSCIVSGTTNVGAVMHLITVPC